MMTKRRFLFFALATLLLSCCGSAQPAQGNGEQPSDDGRYVVILSMDAFRHDLPQMCQTPTLDSIASVGVFAEIKPCFPSNTFPNHYSMATGLHPDHHGIVNNSFYDEQIGKSYSISDNTARKNVAFYKGEPIWNTVERGGQVAHVYTWVGVEAKINGHQPTRWVEYSSSRTRRQLADMVLKALCNPNVKEIPNLTMWYFDEPDAIEHAHTTLSPETKNVVEDIDYVLAYFMREVRKSPVYDKINFIFTADHGMTELSPERYYNLYSLIPNKIQYYYNSYPVTLKPYSTASINEVYETLKAHQSEGHYRVWLRDELPEEFHYGSFKERIYPIVLLPDKGWRVVYKSDDSLLPKENTGSHGFDPAEPDMHMVFYGMGPAFKSGYTHDRVFQNLNDYLIICHILGVEPAANDCVWEDIEGLFKTK
ncbi:MAG: alkaline phosphatase family protein [Tidjanibacter sp.]|nr:alkaline phosphatase family protein [Tidjanibacter sp.]